ncbi:MAG: ThaI family type II restriction endonuclease [Cuniculiplasma sp.]
MGVLSEIFEDPEIAYKIRKKLPRLFKIAELESSRSGKIGMEVGSLRERIIVALLIYKYGESNVKTEIPITESETDVIVCGEPISIKTITNRNLRGIKVIWTVDAQKSVLFQREYIPKCDLILVQINWGGIGAFYYIPLEAQQEVIRRIGRENYFSLPKAGTNPRGIEFSKDAMQELSDHLSTRKIDIQWNIEEIEHNQYKQWLDYWRDN